MRRYKSFIFVSLNINGVNVDYQNGIIVFSRALKEIFGGRSGGIPYINVTREIMAREN